MKSKSSQFYEDARFDVQYSLNLNTVLLTLFFKEENFATIITAVSSIEDLYPFS